MKQIKNALNDNQETRFDFGRNWQHYLSVLDQPRIDEATNSLKEMMGLPSFEGLSFLDVGSGSGLFSLTARNLGAVVTSFDYDASSVACTSALKSKYHGKDDGWTIREGSILDREFLDSLGLFDLVYAWGVLHHTGDMYRSFENIIRLVKPNGKLFISIYNDQGVISNFWRLIKKTYHKNIISRYLVIIAFIPYFILLRSIVRFFRGKYRRHERGMSLWYDMIDWLGGYPFEVAKPNEIILYFSDRGFQMERSKLVGSHQGCNEFIFIYKKAHLTV